MPGRAADGSGVSMPPHATSGRGVFGPGEQGKRPYRLTDRLLSPNARITWSRETRRDGLPVTPVTPHSRHTHPTRPAVPALLVVLLGILVALSLAGPTAAAVPCGKKVLDDWYDNGRVDRIYPSHCYEDAIDLIPRDIIDYSDAEEVIYRSLQYALRGEIGPAGIDPTPGPDGPDDPTNPGGGPIGGPNDPGNPGSGDPPQAAPPIDTSNTSSVPIPLLVLGGMSLALLSAGALGYVSRRRAAAADHHGPDDPTLG